MVLVLVLPENNHRGASHGDWPCRACATAGTHADHCGEAFHVVRSSWSRRCTSRTWAVMIARNALESTATEPLIATLSILSHGLLSGMILTTQTECYGISSCTAGPLHSPESLRWPWYSVCRYAVRLSEVSGYEVRIIPRLA